MRTVRLSTAPGIRRPSLLFGCAAFAWGAAIACAPSHPQVVECVDANQIRAICGFQNPEDLAVLPGNKEVIVSQFGSMDGTRAGNLAVFDAQTEASAVAYSGSGSSTGGGESGAWGDPTCPGPPDAQFSPHGIDLAALPGSTLRLLVVNHGGREAVEFFEVRPGTPFPTLRWRGCAPAPEDAFLNDVVNLPDGGFLVTHMMPRGSGAWGLLKAAAGMDTGNVYAWRPDSGYAVVQGTSAPFPNGIEVSEDGRHIYLNAYSSGEVRKIDRRSGELLGSARVESPDNVTWGSDGRLLVASHRGGLSDQISCMDLDQGACGMEFAIVAVDPLTLETETLLLQAGPPMGGGTVALDLGEGDLLIGSFASDRMLRTRVPR